MLTVRNTKLVDLLFAPPAVLAAATPELLTNKDQYRLQDAAEAQISPDGSRIAYSIRKHDDPARSYTQMWIVEAASGQARP